MVWFRFRTGILKVQHVPSGDDAVSFELQHAGGPVTIELRRNPDHEGPRILLTATASRVVSAERQTSLESLAAREIPPGCTPNEGSDPFNERGAPHLSIVSDSLKNLFAEMGSQMAPLCRSVALSLRWRYGLRVPVRPLASLGYEFSIDGELWISIPREVSARTGSYAIGQALGTQLVIGIPEALEPDLAIPAAHEFLFEAEELADTYTRSTLVLSLAGVEVGLKSLIAGVLPGTRWLVENMPSPSVASLLEGFLPDLPLLGQLPGTERPDPKADLIKNVRRAMQLRNRVVHSGAGEIDYEWLDEWLSLSSSLLYAFDCYSGRAWAGPLVEERHRLLIAT